MRRRKRYQYCHPIVRLWRCRHLLAVPWHAVRCYAYNRRDDEPLSFADCWSIAYGCAHGRMDYVYTSSDCDNGEWVLPPSWRDDPEEEARS